MTTQQRPSIPQAVGKTSLLIAAARAMESAKSENERLFNDPYASTLASEEGFEYLKTFEKERSWQQFITRTRFVDEFVTSTINSTSIRQVVILGAGMDTRALRLPLPEDCHVYEIDFDEVLTYKNALIEEYHLKHQGYKPRSKAIRHCIRMDIAMGPNWADLLVKSGFDNSQPTLWILEGLLFYLKEEDVLGTLGTISHLSASKSRILAHMTPQIFPTAFLNDLGTPMVWTCQEPEKLLNKFGFQDVTVPTISMHPSYFAIGDMK